MFRRTILELSSCRRDRRIPAKIVTQIPSYLSSRKEFPVALQQNQSRQFGSTSTPPESGGSLPKVLIGSVALGAAFLATYQTGYLNKYLKQEPNSNLESEKVDNNLKNVHELIPRYENSNNNGHVEEPLAQESKVLDQVEEKMEAHSGISHTEDPSKSQQENQFEVKDVSQLSPESHVANIQEKESPTYLPGDTMSDDATGKCTEQTDNNHGMENPEVETHVEKVSVDDRRATAAQEDAFLKKNEANPTPLEHSSIKDVPVDLHDNIMKEAGSLLDEYNLRENTEVSTTASSNNTKDLVGEVKELQDSYIDNDGKLVLDFLQAIHAAEKRQAELDALVFAKEKRAMKEKYEKELRDARARELMYAEREAILEKEIDKEKVKAATALKSLQENLEEKLKLELEKKDAESEAELKKLQDLANAELAAAIANEKASQIEKMAEANLHINALCMAFYARSEEARQTHSIHKLALGALALEDALTKGLPIREEIDALHTYLEGLDRDSLFNLVLSSLPEETRNNGTDTLLQLTHKFDTLKGMVRHFSLIPPGGGGILAHSLARIASWLKVREIDQSGDGIESLINRVESLLSEGKLSEAADALESGVQGSQAAEVVGDWVKQVRNRAITEQALTLLQSYAMSISLT